MCLAALLAADLLIPAGRVSLDPPWGFSVFGPTEPVTAPRAGVRLIGPGRALRLSGLWPRARALVSLSVASGIPAAQQITVSSNEAVIFQGLVAGRRSEMPLHVIADPAGVVRLRFAGRAAAGAGATSAAFGTLKVYAMTVRQEGPARVSAQRVAQYLGLALVLALTCALGTASSRAAVIAAVLAGAGWGAALGLGRPAAVSSLPWLISGLTLTVVFLALVRLGRVPGRGWLAACFALRCLLVTHPDFAGIDLAFHTHRADEWQPGLVLTSHVSMGSSAERTPIPYGPLLYALVFVLRGSGFESGPAIRLLMALMEGTAPLLVYALLRRAGVEPRAAGWGAVALAVMPEGVLVLGKGIAANVLGQWLGMLLVLALLAQRPLAVGGLACLVALAHPGAAACFLALAGIWLVADRVRRGISARVFWLHVGAVAIGLLCAWWLYWRHVLGITGGALGALGGPAEGLGVRWVHAAKVPQDLLLKFGAAPLVLAFWARPKGRMRALLSSWLGLAAALGGLAVLTPVALRFEYFAAPAVATLAGLGAERQSDRRLRWMMGLSLALQLVIAGFLLVRRFEIIACIIPSGRWRWPFRWTPIV